ncbi:hypothetical protein QBC45DRAFT_26763 [Copromyces sp. CBS 386.78]|nr:hypothetical protein QBC45DRAFT_26763 [Copromyces sp. CBS 386.78]
MKAKKAVRSLTISGLLIGQMQAIGGVGGSAATYIDLQIFTGKQPNAKITAVYCCLLPYKLLTVTGILGDRTQLKWLQAPQHPDTLTHLVW